MASKHKIELRGTAAKRYGPLAKTVAPVYVVLRFNLPRQVKKEQWKKIQAPPGWRKNPRRDYLQAVMFRTTDPAALLNMTPAWIAEMETRLLLIMEPAP